MTAGQHIGAFEPTIAHNGISFSSRTVRNPNRVFANATLVTTRTPAAADFFGPSPKLLNWGVNDNRGLLSLCVKWTLFGKQKVAAIAAAKIGAAGYNYQAERFRLGLPATTV